MSDEGVRLVSRVVLLVVLIVTAAAFRAFLGSNRKRGRIATAGTLGGLTLGVLVAPAISRWVGTDVSVLAVLSGILFGWAVTWLATRNIPREAS